MNDYVLNTGGLSDKAASFITIYVVSGWQLNSTIEIEVILILEV